MKLDFNAIPAVTVPHFKGGEGEAVVRKFDDERMGGCVHVTLAPGSSIGMHTHQGNCEVVRILAGCGTCYDDEEVYPIQAGDYTYCPEGHSHSIVNTGTEPLVLYGVLPKVQ